MVKPLLDQKSLQRFFILNFGLVDHLLLMRTIGGIFSRSKIALEIFFFFYSYRVRQSTYLFKRVRYSLGHFYHLSFQRPLFYPIKIMYISNNHGFSWALILSLLIILFVRRYCYIVSPFKACFLVRLFSSVLVVFFSLLRYYF